MNSIARIYRTGFLLLASALVIFAGVDLFEKVLLFRSVETVCVPVGGEHTPPVNDRQGPDGRRAVDYQVIASRNLFGASEAAPEDEQLVDIENLQQTSLALTLLGTIDGDGRARRVIIREDKEQRQDIYREGDEVQQALVKKILRGKVVLSLRGKDEILIMEDDGAPSASTSAAQVRRGAFSTSPTPVGSGSAAEIALFRRDIERVLSDVRTLRVGVEMRPHLSGGKVDGIMLTEIKAGSFFRLLDLRKNDIVKFVNGKPVTSPEGMSVLYSTLMAGDPVAVQFKRGGRRRTINYILKE